MTNNLNISKFPKSKLVVALLVVFGFYITVSIISNTFDGDFGWHLRFGKDALENNFQYVDSYTWSYFNKSWVNHEWGGDIVFWHLYSKFGYFSLVILASVALWLSFLLAIKIFNKKLTAGSILIAIFSLFSINFILMMRLSMVAPLFFVLLWWSLEKLPRRKTYYCWPIILWLWSIFHGSWILGFIVINIYLAGNIIQLFITKIAKAKAEIRGKILNLLDGRLSDWTKNTIVNVVIWQIIAALIVLINPYGWKIWQEIILYFTSSYFKSWINEWLPSYSYPIYWWPIIIAAIVVSTFIVTWKQKRISWPQLLLFALFFISAMQYKRNNFYLVLISAPILTLVWERNRQACQNLLSPRKIKLACFFIYTAAMVCAVWLTPRFHYVNDIWSDKYLQARFDFPLEATKFLQAKTDGQENIRIFNAYGWGGYFNWTLPNALVYLDGRSAATWRTETGGPLLREYIDLLTKKGGLAELEKNMVSYVILKKNLPSYPKPNWINKLLFSKQDLERVISVEPFILEDELNNSVKWKLIYSDQISNVWQFTP